MMKAYIEDTQQLGRFIATSTIKVLLAEDGAHFAIVDGDQTPVRISEYDFDHLSGAYSNDDA